MENTTVQRMVMRVRIQDVSDRSSAIEYVGQGTWFDGKPFIVTRYKSNPTNFYFFVYDSFVPEYNYFDAMNSGFGKEIHQLNPDNGYFSGKTFVYSTMLDKMYEPYSVSPVQNSPCCLFEIR
jgi:hypothetical protein